MKFSRLHTVAAGAALLCSSCVTNPTIETTSAADTRTYLEHACGQHAAPILAGQFIDAGTATISNDDEFIYVDVSSHVDLGWYFTELHLYVGTGPLPVNNAGVPAPGQFPYTKSFEPPASSYLFAISLESLGLPADLCGQSLVVALHADMIQMDDESGEQTASETGWAFGDNEFDSPRWGWWFEYELCCEPVPEVEDDCTLTQGYWKTHNETATQPGLMSDWPEPEDEANELCGQTWLDILHAPPVGGDAWIILAHQWIAARLNVASGASTGDQVDQSLADAEAILVENCDGLPTDTRADALYLAGVLDEYNNGVIGPGHCGDAL